MKMSDYTDIMSVLFSDFKTYKETNKDQTVKVEKLNNDIIKNFYNNGIIDNRTKYELMVHQ